MEDMALPWFKFWSADYLSDPKTRSFTSHQHSCWLHLLCFAANSTTPGVIKFLDDSALADVLRKTSLHFENYDEGSATSFDNIPEELKQRIMHMIVLQHLQFKYANKLIYY